MADLLCRSHLVNGCSRPRNGVRRDFSCAGLSCSTETPLSIANPLSTALKYFTTVGSGLTMKITIAMSSYKDSLTLLPICAVPCMSPLSSFPESSFTPSRVDCLVGSRTQSTDWLAVAGASFGLVSLPVSPQSGKPSPTLGLSSSSPVSSSVSVLVQNPPPPLSIPQNVPLPPFVVHWSCNGRCGPHSALHLAI